MKKLTLIPLVLFILLVSACSEDETELYEENFQPDSENWNISFHVIQLPRSQEFREVFTIKLDYLKKVNEEGITFEYELIHGYPPKGSVRSPEHQILKGEVFEETLYDQNVVHTLLYDIITLIISWQDADGRQMEEEFVFPEKPEVTAEGFRAEIERYVEATIEGTSLNNIELDDDFGTDKEGTGNILVHMSIPEETDAKTAKDMIDVFSEQLSVRFSHNQSVEEVTIFWEVPHLKEGENVAKISATRDGREARIVERWYDETVFDY